MMGDMKTDVVVIGGGIMGSTIASFLRCGGREVVLFDDGRPESGSRASGGLIKPSKFTGLSNEANTEVLRVMGNLFGVTPEPFVIRPSFDLLKMDIHRVDMDRLFAEPRVHARVTAVRPARGAGSMHAVEFKHGVDEGTAQCNFIVLAAGYWCGELFPSAFPGGSLTAQKGVSFRFSGRIKQSFVQAWAPYKQITVHNTLRNGRPEVWTGDGTALKPGNWTQTREAECLARVRGAMKIAAVQPVLTTTGLRPFHESGDKPCYLREIRRDIWAATGAGKFGCISAAWAASRLAGELL